MREAEVELMHPGEMRGWVSISKEMRTMQEGPTHSYILWQLYDHHDFLRRSFILS